MNFPRPHPHQPLTRAPVLRPSTRIPLAFELLTPTQVCGKFAQGLSRPVRYTRGPIEIKVSVPAGYRAQLDGIAVLFGQYQAPYFGPDLQPLVPAAALALWEGYRGIEEYAREVFPVEEEGNGLDWMM